MMLNNQVANLSKKVMEHDKQVDELHKSIADLTVTIRQLANNNSYSGQGQGVGRGRGRSSPKTSP
eukprot:4708303-Ditylum_brightwellii.AAC.1